MEQQNEASPIWAINLFERRKFRNGNEEAQCLECGMSFATCELVTMTAHIVEKHSEYAAKLVAKQLEFGGGGVFHLQQKVAKMDGGEEEGRPPSFSTCLTPATAVSIGNTDSTIISSSPTPSSFSSTAASAFSNSQMKMEIMQTDDAEKTMANASSLPFSLPEKLSSALPKPTAFERANNEKAKGDDGGICCQEDEQNVNVPSETISTASSVTSNSYFESKSCSSTVSLMVPNSPKQQQDDPFTRPSSPSAMPNFSPLSSALNTVEDSCCNLSDTVKTATSFDKTTTKSVDEIYMDRFGKEWRLLVSHPISPALLDHIAGKHFLCRKGPTKHDGRIYFSCRLFSARQCSHRGLYLPERQALFYRRTHNHPTAKPKSNNSLAETKANAAKQSKQQKSVGGKKRGSCGTFNGEDIIMSAFTAALPDIGTTAKSIGKKKGTAKRGTKTPSMPAAVGKELANANSCDESWCLSPSSFNQQCMPPVVTDRAKNLWHLLAILPDANTDTVLNFCSQYYVNKMNTSNGGKRIRYWCRYRRPPLQCPFRIMHLLPQNALYYRSAHSHSMPLTSEQMNSYTQRRKVERLLSINKKMLARLGSIDAKMFGDKEKVEEQQPQQVQPVQCTNCSDNDNNTADGTVMEPAVAENIVSASAATYNQNESKNG